MAILTLTAPCKSIHGRIGNYVYLFRRGRQIVRPYVKPSNPDTEKQRYIRNLFSEAVLSWQNISDNQKAYWNKCAAGKPVSGYNMYISSYIKRVTLSENSVVNEEYYKKTIALDKLLLRFKQTKACIVMNFRSTEILIFYNGMFCKT